MSCCHILQDSLVACSGVVHVLSSVIDLEVRLGDLWLLLRTLLILLCSSFDLIVVLGQSSKHWNFDWLFPHFSLLLLVKKMKNLSLSLYNMNLIMMNLSKLTWLVGNIGNHLSHFFTNNSVLFFFFKLWFQHTMLVGIHDHLIDEIFPFCVKNTPNVISINFLFRSKPMIWNVAYQVRSTFDLL